MGWWALCLSCMAQHLLYACQGVCHMVLLPLSAQLFIRCSLCNLTHAHTCNRFRLIGMRSPMQFLFFRGGLDAPVLAARSHTMEWANPNEPLQRRLALTRDNT